MSTAKRKRQVVFSSDSESSDDECVTQPAAPVQSKRKEEKSEEKSDEEKGDEEKGDEERVQAQKRSDARQRLVKSTQNLEEKRKRGKLISGPGTKGSDKASAKVTEASSSSAAAASIASLLRSRPAIPEGDYTQEERVVSEFQRFHPMCNAISRDVLQKISEMVERVPIRVPELPVVGKAYEDMHLRPPNMEIGERPCVSGDDCLCRFLARLRYGEGDPRSFVGVEFLLPAQRERWQSGYGLPDRQGKCLVCQRYWTTRLYLMARSNPSFRMNVGGKFLMQTHSNPVLLERDAARSVFKGLDGSQELPTHVNTVNCVDGYIPDAMLYADEEFVQSHASREGNASALPWKPVVRFDSSHYRYVMGDSGPFIVQVGIGNDLNSLPSLDPSGPATASKSTDETKKNNEGTAAAAEKKRKHANTQSIRLHPGMKATRTASQTTAISDQESTASLETQHTHST